MSVCFTEGELSGEFYERERNRMWQGKEPERKAFKAGLALT